MWSVDFDTCPYKQTEEDGTISSLFSEEEFNADPRVNVGWIDDEIRFPQMVSSLPSKIEKPVIFSPSNLSFDEANQFLQYGFCKESNNENKDIRLGTGEFIILYKYNSAEEIDGLLRIQSTASAWRSEIRDNNPNLMFRFFQIIDDASLDTNQKGNFDRYISKYPLMSPISLDEVKTHLQTQRYMTWPQSVQKVYLGSRDQRLYNIFLCYLMSVPIHRQSEVVTFYDEVYRRRTEVTEWLQSVDVANTISSPSIPDRGRKIISDARKEAQRRVERGLTTTRDGAFYTFSQTTAYLIRGFIQNEYGISLYRLGKACEEAKEEKE
jgi:hypothetical protein